MVMNSRLKQSHKENIAKFIKDHLSTVAFDKRRWAAGIKSLLAKSIAKEEGSKQPAQYVAKEDVVETESMLPPIRPNTKSCESAILRWLLGSFLLGYRFGK